jgi:hypothetical protein
MAEEEVTSTYNRGTLEVEVSSASGQPNRAVDLGLISSLGRRESVLGRLGLFRQQVRGTAQHHITFT